MPAQAPRPKRQPRKAAPAPSIRIGAKPRRSAASRSAHAPIHTSDALTLARPPPKKRAEKEIAAAPNAPRGQPTRSPAARTGGDASIGRLPSVTGSQTVYIGQTVRTPRVGRLKGRPGAERRACAHFE